MKIAIHRSRSIAIVMIGLALISGVFGRNPQAAESKPRTYVLVHGAWGGGWAFKQLAGLLERAGHQVYRPTLTGLGERVHLASPEVGLQTHIQDITNLLVFEELSDVILVGHSYGGMVVTAVADQNHDRIAHLVYVDAHLPENGQSMFDLIPPARRQRLLGIAKQQGDGWRIPPQWSKPEQNVPHPVATFQDTVNVGKLDASVIPGSYILTLEAGATEDAFSASALRASKRGWQVHKMETGHNPQWTKPRELAAILLGIK